MDDKSKQRFGSSIDHAKYVVAVSGGVDSVVLLHILVQCVPPQRLVVAHFDHGIREDSAEDQRLVARLAKDYNLGFTSGEGYLGPGASEAAARQARYDFLRRTKDAVSADYIVTAHHEDDLLETAVLNLLRGTGRKGLAALRSHGDLYRPLLSTPKEHIRQYARRYGLEWREDSTNANPDYLRNYIRMNIMSRFDDEARQRLRQLIADTHDKNLEIDGLLAEQLHLQPAGDTLDRHWFIMLPHAVAREIVAAWLRRLGIAGFDRQLLERIAVAGKTFAPGKRLDINARYILEVQADRLVVVPRVE